MGQYFGFETIPAPVKQTNTTVRLPAGFHKKVNGLGFSSTSAIDCDLTTTGANGLDTGSLAAFTLYFVYLVNNSGTAALVTSTAAPSTGPTGFTAYELIYAFYSNESSQIGCFVSIEGAPISTELGYIPVIDGVTSAPTKATTTVTDQAFWSRVGGNIFVTYDYKHTDNTGAAAGSGNYIFGLPGSFQIATTRIGDDDGTVVLGNCGTFTASNATSNREGIVQVYGAAGVLGMVSTSGTVGANVGSSEMSLDNVTFLAYSMSFKVPIQGWSNTPLKDL